MRLLTLLAACLLAACDLHITNPAPVIAGGATCRRDYLRAMNEIQRRGMIDTFPAGKPCAYAGGTADAEMAA